MEGGDLLVGGVIGLLDGREMQQGVRFERRGAAWSSSCHCVI